MAGVGTLKVTIKIIITLSNDKTQSTTWNIFPYLKLHTQKNYSILKYEFKLESILKLLCMFADKNPTRNTKVQKSKIWSKEMYYTKTTAVTTRFLVE